VDVEDYMSLGHFGFLVANEAPSGVIVQVRERRVDHQGGGGGMSSTAQERVRVAADCSESSVDFVPCSMGTHALLIGI
jgi:hypothetical protein